jgi:hypothetical protein
MIFARLRRPLKRLYMDGVASGILPSGKDIRNTND